ncbi:MAG TPA: helix-turn-helix transcriptional regulator [Polyangiaceae bacterium]|jgi:hypothetical protein|nr:helix-turn-helix transcriptional regulator [Polyangiaceae bacterium]
MTDAVLLVDHEGNSARYFEALNPKILRSTDEVQSAFDTHSRRALWIVPKSSGMKPLSTLRGGRRGDHRLLCLGHIEGVRREILHAHFRFVVAPADGVKLLPIDEMAEVLAAPHREDLFIGGAVDTIDRALVLYRGSLEPLVVPLAWFARSGGPRPDPEDFEVADFGQTIRLGEFEAAADAILYEFDPEARRRSKKRAIAEDQSFGGALRRLRKERGVRREDFEGVSAKEIARLERGEVDKPHADTLHKIAKTLGVSADELETY